jgi:rod shape-determining protein MreC
MSLRDSQFGELKVPLTWTAAVALIVAAVVAVALLLTDRRETFRAEAYGAARGAADSVMAPVGDVLSAPGRWTGAGVDAIRGYFFAVSENRRLKGELSDMRQWRDVAFALKNENNRYRSLLGLKTEPPIPMVAARVVTDSRGPFADTRIANTGREAGVKPGNPVMSEYGLVGRVIGVTDNASRVLLLTDAASRTPVMIDRTNARAILTGDGGPNPRLDYLRGQDPVREGDRILTSGDGGILPRGLPVGVAVKGLDGKWRVVMASDKGPIDFVRILLFQDFTQVINRKDLEQLPTPPPTPGVPPSNVIVEPAPLAAAGASPAAAAAAGGAAKPAQPGASAASPPTSPTTGATTGAAKPAELKAADGKPAAAAAAQPGTAKSADKPSAKAASAKTPAEHAAKPAGKTSATADHVKPAVAQTRGQTEGQTGGKTAPDHVAAAKSAAGAAHDPAKAAAAPKPPAKPKPAAKPAAASDEEPPI